MAQVAMGIDIGGTKMAAGLVDPQGKMLYSQTVATPSELAELKSELFDLIDNLLVEAQKGELVPTPLDVIGIGVAVPGVVCREQGITLDACNLPWQEFAIGKVLEDKYGMQTRVENDADAAALGVYYYAPEAQGIENFVLLTIGTGVGGGIILNGKLHGGGWPLLGEVGHMIILPDGPLCNCGSRGCLEALASGTAIGRQALEKVQVERHGYLWFTLQKTGKVTAADVVAGAGQGDDLATRVLQEAAYFLAIGVLNVHRLLSPEAIIVGGGVVQESDILIRYTQEALAQVHPRESLLPRIIQVKGGSISGVKGAAALIWEEARA